MANKKRVFNHSIEQILVDLSANQESDMGKALAVMYYGKMKLLDLAPNPSGYPHNGADHTFHIRGEKTEVSAFIDLFEEIFSKKFPGVLVFLAEIRTELNNA